MSSTSPLRSRIISFWIVVATGLLVQRPVSHPDLWWHLSRGREVCAGAASPSRGVLTLDRARESDWLGGVPFYLAWSAGGVNALAATPLLSAALAVWLAHRKVAQRTWAWVSLPLVVWTMRSGLQPTPQLFDMAGLAAVWWVLYRAEKHPAAADGDTVGSAAGVVGADGSALSRSRARCIAIGTLIALWANFAPATVWGLLAVVLLSPTGRFEPKLVLASLLGGVLTPRGLWTWTDSIVLFAPRTLRDARGFEEPLWTGVLDARLQSSEVAFLALWGCWLAAGLVSQPTPHSASRLVRFARMCVPLLAALLCRNNIPLCGLWVLLCLMNEDAVTVDAASASGAPWRRLRSVLQFGAAAVLLGLAAIDAGATPGSRFGWGISHALDVRLLDLGAAQNSHERLTAWAADRRSAGLGAWLGARVVDHPQRALLAGRWRQHAALVDDLIGAHRARYRRDDGSWGGWVRRLQEWNVDLLLIRAEDVRLNRALLETPWKPIDLDSPTVPYVSANDLRFATVIVESLKQQAFVEAGPWRPTLAIYDGHGWRADFVELAGFGPDPGPAIRQSQLFRSVELPMASLRALLPMRQRVGIHRLKAEFQACQLALATSEQLESGRVSRFRSAVLQALDSSGAWSSSSNGIGLPSTAWRDSIELYLDGDLAQSVESLPEAGSQPRYAAGLLWLEMGDSARALEAMQQVLASDDRAARISADAWVWQLAPFELPRRPDN